MKSTQKIQDQSLFNNTDSENSYPFVKSQNTKNQNYYQSGVGVNTSLKETKCSTLLENEKSLANNSQIEGKSSLFSLQFREINSQQNQNMIDQSINIPQKSLNGEDNQHNIDNNNYNNTELENLHDQNHIINVKTSKSQSMNCYSLGRNIMNDNDSEDFRTSLLNATKNSRVNRDRLRNDLIRSNIIQQNASMYGDQHYDDEEEAENMFPSKGRSMLISIKNFNKTQDKGGFQVSTESQNQNIIDLIDSCCLNYQQENQIKKGNLFEQNELPDQKRRRSSSLHQVKFGNQCVTSKIQKENSDVKVEEHKSDNKSNVIIATAYSLPSEVCLDSQKKKKNNNEVEQKEQKMSQAQVVAMKLNQDKEDQENETEYYDEDYYLSNRKEQESQKYDIKFHKSFFNNDTNINGGNNLQQSQGSSRSREQTDHFHFNTEVNHFTTEFNGSNRVTENNNMKFSDKIEASQIFHMRLSNTQSQSPADLMRLSSTTYDQQTIGGAISLQTFMETKQNAVMKDWIQKRSSNLLVGWQKRWLVLKNKKLQYFKTDESTHYQGCIDFSILGCSIQRVINLNLLLIYRIFLVKG